MEPRRFDVLLVGGGVAAVRCARALRRGKFAGSIAIVGDEPVAPYNRPPLSKELLRDEIPMELVLAESPSWYARRGVELLLGTSASRLDPGERLVELADGRRLRYGDCLLATGAEAIRPPIPGAETVLLLRTLMDAEALRDRARPGGRAVVIGGGFIGVEAAASLAERGLTVTVLERSLSLWGGALGPAVSEWATRRLAAAGVEVRFDATVTAAAADGVVVDGDLVGADLTLAGVGVRPISGLAEDAGLEVADGILVDGGQRVAPHLFAAGDVARPRDADRVEHWHAAREGGERAAASMLGALAPPHRAPWIFSEFAGAQLDVVGTTVDGDEELEVAAGVYATTLRGAVKRVAICDGAVAVDAARELVERGGPPEELRRLAG